MDSIEIAREVLRLEAASIHYLSSQLTNTFQEAVESINFCSGRCVFTGVGKSAIIGQKIVATFNSIGVPAVFLHAADALHGDLGIISREDLVIFLSKSGETPELKILLPYVKKTGNKTVALVTQSGSYLARECAIFVHVPIDREADPYNLVPTSSTIVQLAIGDALAVCLMKIRSFQPMHFALLHPGGMLGKQLNLRVIDLACQHPKPLISELAPIRDVIVEISAKRLGMTTVKNQKGQITGIITDGDLRRMLENQPSFDQLVAMDIMSKNPKWIEPEAKAIEALEVMRQYNITQLLVLHKEEYLGVIHIHDLLKEGF